MERVDVAIVGGGPAGSSLAWGLRGSGLRVRILDRATFPRDKTCAGWVTPAVWRALGLSPADYAATGFTLQPIRGFEVGRIGGHSAKAIQREVVSYGIRRCEFDAYLLGRCGAELRLGEPVRAVARERDGWLVNGALHARLLVGAGGHFCPVARALVAVPNKEPAIAAQEIEAPLRASEARELALDAEVPELWFTRDLAGYGWVFRKGGFLNVGIGRRGGGVADAMRSFLAQLRESRRIPVSWDGAARGHAYLTYSHATRPLWRAGAALIGDAAGFAHDKSGEGIRPAIESGLLLARALLRARSAIDGAALEAYAESVCARFGSRARSLDGAGFALPAWQAAAVGALLGRPWFARRVVVQRWFLNLGQAELAPQRARSTR
jgi:flavin-dependent dehydrogenase